MKFNFKQSNGYIEIYAVLDSTFSSQKEYIGLAKTVEEADTLIERYKAANDLIKQLESKYGQ
jgi:hypothetical protein